MSWKGDLAKARGATSNERLVVLEAVVRLAVSRFCLVVLPFRRVASLSRLTITADHESATPHDDRTERVEWAIRAAAARTPWQSTCLAQSLAASVMLRRRAIDSTLYLGVAKDEAGHIVAHSWLRSGGEVVTGGRGHHSFSVIAAYGAHPRAVDGATTVAGPVRSGNPS